MIPPGMNYRAVRDIPAPGSNAIAYRKGHLVHESAVTGPDAWLTLGVEVEGLKGADLAEPTRNASHDTWAAFLVATAGLDPDKGADMSRAALIEMYDKRGQEPAATESTPAGPAATTPAASTAAGSGKAGK